jgi:tRNA modification GTPase
MIPPIDDATIIAQCTPKGSGAVALIRISGNDAITIASKLTRLASGQSLANQKSHTIHYGNVINDSGQTIDSVLFLLMHSPKTFTGQDTVEITTHNNQFVIEKIIQTAICHGARLAQNGEFARRAYMAGKIDLLQAEAMNELINANNQFSLRQSLAQLHGSFSNYVVTIEKELITCLALCHASFEFIDEEIEFADQIKAMISNIIDKLCELEKSFDQQKQIRQGIRIAIIGSVNAGKSALFNALLGQNRAIVTPIAGTTRDSIEAGVYHDQTYWTFVDTAGLRQTDDIIEQQGIERSYEQAALADIILLVFDVSVLLSHQQKTIYKNLIDTYENKIILVGNKVDVRTNSDLDFANALLVSASTKHNIDLLQREIENKITQQFTQAESPFLLNQRHFNILLSLKNALKYILAELENPHYELISEQLQQALESLTALTGKTISERAMDAVFKEFCVGK